jgi:3-methyladenine DNA glycosylase AlkD
MLALNLINDLQKLANKKQAEILSRFFKTGKGQYGEGDIFWGIKVPIQREVAKKFKEILIKELQKTINHPVHEVRLTSALILTYKFPKSSVEQKKEIVNFYLKNTKYFNNWDLVDLSAPKILGEYFLKNPDEKEILYKLAKSKNLWEKRIAMLTTYTFIKKKEFNDALKISEILLNDSHDLIHKAVGWMLREIGKMDQKIEEEFLQKHYKKMPRTMLRYAIEKFSEQKKNFYMGRN